MGSRRQRLADVARHAIFPLKGAIGGFNAGAAMVFWTNDVGFRSGITWHRFQDFRESVWLVEIGIVHAR